MGDVVLIQYEDKSKSGTFRLGVIIAVEEDRDGLVRTVTVQYSLLADLPVQDRLLYRGVKKKLRVPVQRLVLILPVEERNLSSKDDNFLSGEQAGTAPHKEDVGRGGGDHLDFQDDQVSSEEHVQVFKCFKKRFKGCAINENSCSVKTLKRRFLRDCLMS